MSLNKKSAIQVSSETPKIVRVWQAPRMIRLDVGSVTNGGSAKFKKKEDQGYKIGS